MNVQGVPKKCTFKILRAMMAGQNFTVVKRLLKYFYKEDRKNIKQSLKNCIQLRFRVTFACLDLINPEVASPQD